PTRVQRRPEPLVPGKAGSELLVEVDLRQGQVGLLARTATVSGLPLVLVTQNLLQDSDPVAQDSLFPTVTHRAVTPAGGLVRPLVVTLGVQHRQGGTCPF